MSRSYREPWFVDGYGSRWKRHQKRAANRRVRHAKNVPNGNAYRRYFDPWNICDWKYCWDPMPHVYWLFGELRIIEPTPEWKARRK